MTSTPPRPTVLLVPGGWHRPSAYQDLTDRLLSDSFPIRPLQNPSLNSSAKGLLDDIANVRAALQQLVEHEGKEVVVLLHSYGGLPGVFGVTGFGRIERQKSGKTGGVAGVVCMCTTVLPAGVSQVNAKGRDQWLYWPEGGELFYNDIAPEAAQAQIDKLQPQGFLSFDEDPPPYSLGEIPVTYLMCSQDNALLPAVQERVVKLLGQNCTVERCDAGHSPFVNKLDLIIELVKSVANKKA
ncbi:hypothetical protein ACLMJK_002919 [Lecanora helva]